MIDDAVLLLLLRLLLLERARDAALAIVKGLRRFADEDANDPAERDLLGNGDESIVREMYVQVR